MSSIISWKFLLTFSCIFIAHQPVLPMSVLIVHPVYAGSHVLTLQSIANNLLQNNNKVTTIRYKDDHNLQLPSHPNQTHMLRTLDNRNGHIPYITKEKAGSFQIPQELLWSRGHGLISGFLGLKNPWVLMEAACSDLLNPDLVGQLRNDKFDIAIIDLIYNECGLALASQLGIPAVGYWAFAFTGGEQTLSTAPAMPSHVPMFMAKLTDQMSLMERTVNVLRKIFDIGLVYYHAYSMTWILNTRLNIPLTAQDLVGNLSGMFINSDYTIDYPRPLPPTFINIGGIQIKQQPSPLPSDIQQFMDTAPAGVMLFTMGFIFNPDTAPVERVQTFLNVFRRLPQRVIMKYDVSGIDHKFDIPQNVMMKPFLPQADILGHNQCSLFLTHCGMHGVLEAVYYGVPMVGIPVFIDQGDVLAKMVQREIALGIDKFATEEEIFSAIVTVRDTPLYRERVEQLSRLLKNRRTSPMEEVLWLLDYVVATGGAEHLKVSSRHLNLLQYFCLDAIAIIIALTGMIIYMCSYCCCSKRKRRFEVSRKALQKKTH